MFGVKFNRRELKNLLYDIFIGRRTNGKIGFEKLTDEIRKRRENHKAIWNWTSLSVKNIHATILVLFAAGVLDYTFTKATDCIEVRLAKSNEKDTDIAMNDDAVWNRIPASYFRLE